MKTYPKYLTYSNRNRVPSVLKQVFPLPSITSVKRFYPKNVFLASSLISSEAERKFEISQFYFFLKDTIEVEHFLVIPAIASLKRINFNIPFKAKEDLYKIVTDEGFHAEQSLVFLNSIEQQFQFNLANYNLPANFVQKLELQKSNPKYRLIKDLLPVIFGIVTETRISIELGQFAKQTDLDKSVREICLSHSIDEVIHSSQFQALGEWLWDQMDEKIKTLVSASFIDAIIFRNSPSIDSLIQSLSFANNISLQDAKKIVLSQYNEVILINEMLEVCMPTFKYLLKNRIVNQFQIDERIRKEKTNIKKDLFNG